MAGWLLLYTGRVVLGMAGGKFSPGDILLPGGELRFYYSTEWKHKRKEILKRDRHECTMCRAEGTYHKAECVHHIVHLKDNPYLALSDSNLTSLCNTHHNQVHPEKFGHEEPFKNLEWF